MAKGVRIESPDSRGEYGFDGNVAGAFGMAATGVSLLVVAIVLFAKADDTPLAFAALIVAALVLATICIYLHTTRRGKFAVWAELLAALRLSGDEHVLDVGCGRGAVLAMVAKMLPRGRAAGIDLWSRADQSGSGQAAAERNIQAEGVSGRCELVTGDMRSLPFPNESFDVVVSSLAIHNVREGEGRLRAIDEIARVTKPGGRVVLADLAWTKRYAEQLQNNGFCDVCRVGLGWRFWWAPGIATSVVTASKPKSSAVQMSEGFTLASGAISPNQGSSQMSRRISGRALEIVAWFAQTRMGARVLVRVFRASLRLPELERLPERYFGEVPVDNRPLAGRSFREMPNAGLALPRASWSPTSETLTESYLSGETTPRVVVDRALAAARFLASRRPGVGPLLHSLDETARRDADASTERWHRGTPLGPLDGVPIVIKEQLAVRGLPARGGSDLSDAKLAEEDATLVARLRSAGAIILGQTPMTEYGMSPFGINPKRAMPRNPHASDRLAGGSSTGSVVAVATGLVPLAIGGDGGGSIRLPSSLCGVFGLKPTWGRVSRTGDMLGGSVGHVGPIASSTIDLARCLEAVAGFDERDLETEQAPSHADGTFTRALSRGVRGMRIGIVGSEWSDASPAVCRAGMEALRALEKEGAVLVDLRLDLARWAPSVGPLTIGIESMSGHRALIARQARFNADLRISYAVLAQLSVSEYVHAQRLRAGMRREMACAFGDVDLVALPSAATTAPRVTDAEFENGFLDPPVLFAMGRFMYLGNLTGVPALSAPVGLDENRLPLGLQLLGDAWDEATVLAAAAHLERLGVARVERPAVTATSVSAGADIAERAAGTSMSLNPTTPTELRS